MPTDQPTPIQLARLSKALDHISLPPDQGGYLQTTGYVWAPTKDDQDSFCILGALANEAALQQGVAFDDLMPTTSTNRATAVVKQFYGLDNNAVRQLVVWNDRGRPLPKLAAFLRRQHLKP